MEHMHGGNIIDFEKQYGKLPVDFSININPLGMPTSVRDAAEESIANLDKYVDPFCQKLTAAVSAKEHVPASNVLFGAGVTDLLFRLMYAKKPKRAIVLAPSFAEYEKALVATGCEVIRHVLLEENEFAVTDKLLAVLTKDVDMLIIGEPNNPTGQCTSKALLEAILSKCAENGILLVVDESFNGFLSSPQETSMKDKTKLYNNLLVLRGMSNLYAMPGLRVGYGISADTNLLNQMQQMGQPWAVSGVAQAATLAALADVGYLLRTQAALIEEKKVLWDCLNIAGFKIIGSKANYLFFKATMPDFGKKMAEKGIMVRDCANYAGLAEGYYRLAVRTRAHNRVFIAALKDIL